MPSPPLIPKKNLSQIHKCFPISWSKSLHSPPSATPSEKERDELKPPPSPAAPLMDSISSLSAHGRLSEAFAAFSLLLRLHSSSPCLLVRPLTSLLSCSTARRALPQGQQLHALVLSLGLSDNPYLVFKLTSLYSAFDLLADAHAVVEGAIKMQTLPWNLLLSAYVRNGCWEDAILAYKQMVERGVRVDKFTYSAVLKACGEMRELELGREIHRRIDGSGLEWDLYVWNALVALYVKCGALEVARKVFDGMAERDVVTWNSMISGYASKGMWEEAFQLLERMPETSEVNTVTWNTIIAGNLQMSNFMEVLRLISQMRIRGSAIDYVTLVIGLKACSRLGSVRVGKEIHGLAIRFHCEKLENVKNALITMYSRCKNTGNAYILFRTSATQSLITWNAMMAGFVHIDQAEEACLLFQEMIGCRIWPNYVTVTIVLSLCARVANLRHGRELHCYVTKLGFEGYQSLWNSLVDMYSKSGRMVAAQRVFDFMKGHDKISYTSLIAGYGLQGKGITSLKLFNEMIDCGIEPDHITMVAVLSACSHSGLVTQGQMIFGRMVGLYGIVAQVEHYSCMVDLYGRAGLLRKAEKIIDQMPLQPSAAMLATLVEACRLHGNIEIGERAAKKLLEMKSDNPSHYVLIANMYASARCWHELAKVRILMRDMGIQKAPSCSWLDLGNNLYPFQVDSTSMQQVNSISFLLWGLADQMRDAGYFGNEEIWFAEAIG
ncbi:pentatricopeptide repeat-containing protein At1g71490 [Elaeis guineensis]|uniref:Pentatricopeptide repeat-containing protein At1g71490 n=1 Tax=Elaeis guineensis var. tenera TaxID=51953 RepID=A0A6J0PLJ9_ELAGV|nr:pentatricopeptide repeat-containing protein At1g71490 [Elaeis guineensis]XP_019707968.1 pentatricopeptide repeat-containing protein At1g71490 [Elaeis guineensis]XP_029121854.1 pentatricopeptide repeat-containing protein At1g71490 [Elaeis guineensis]XP_029121855.1 pentatricopeptide repeat-containing protein At1g71490 [Elaeis guineensis]XP_029121856.1 pentatricopeptide repeat-containing protein At1g71490 [Elaeis guineensis]XP_029121857.1 pentatricopeptide repeat-containing protein At1g71490 [